MRFPKPALTFTLFCLAVLLSPVLTAQSKNTENTLKLDPGSAPPAATVEDFAWMAGNWRGTGFGGIVEESWSPPLAGMMTGTFRLVQNDKTNFFEIMVIAMVDDRPVLRVKHFTPEFVGWEEKDGSVDFPLVRAGKREAFFRGLTIRRPDDDTLLVYLSMKSRDGKRREELLKFHRN